MLRKIKNLIKKKLNTSSIRIQSDSNVDSNSMVGEYTYIGKRCVVTKAIIGRYCSIGNNVSIGIGEHDYTKISTSAQFYDDPYLELTAKEVIVEDDVWIGTDVVILRGVRIGRGAVIGANSVVTKDIPRYAIAVGVPAKSIKYRFPEGFQKKIEESHWWEMNKNEAIKIFEKLKETSDDHY